MGSYYDLAQLRREQIHTLEGINETLRAELAEALEERDRARDLAAHLEAELVDAEKAFGEDLGNVTASPDDVQYESGWHDGFDYGYRLAERELLCPHCGRRRDDAPAST